MYNIVAPCIKEREIHISETDSLTKVVSYVLHHLVVSYITEWEIHISKTDSLTKVVSSAPHHLVVSYYRVVGSAVAQW